MTCLARQRAQAGALVAGHGRIVAEFYDAGQSRTVAWQVQEHRLPHRWPQPHVRRSSTLGVPSTRPR